MTPSPQISRHQPPNQAPHTHTRLTRQTQPIRSAHHNDLKGNALASTNPWHRPPILLHLPSPTSRATTRLIHHNRPANASLTLTSQNLSISTSRPTAPGHSRRRQSHSHRRFLHRCTRNSTQPHSRRTTRSRFSLKLSYRDLNGNQNNNVIQDFAGSDLPPSPNSTSRTAPASADPLNINTAEIDAGKRSRPARSQSTHTTPSKSTFS